MKVYILSYSATTRNYRDIAVIIVVIRVVIRVVIIVVIIVVIRVVLLSLGIASHPPSHNTLLHYYTCTS